MNYCQNPITQRYMHKNHQSPEKEVSHYINSQLKGRGVSLLISRVPGSLINHPSGHPQPCQTHRCIIQKGTNNGLCLIKFYFSHHLDQYFCLLSNTTGYKYFSRFKYVILLFYIPQLLLSIQILKLLILSLSLHFHYFQCLTLSHFVISYNLHSDLLTCRSQGTQHKIFKLFI